MKKSGQYKIVKQVCVRYVQVMRSGGKNRRKRMKLVPQYYSQKVHVPEDHVQVDNFC